MLPRVVPTLPTLRDLGILVCSFHARSGSARISRQGLYRCPNYTLLHSLQGWGIYSERTLAIFTMGVCTSERTPHQPEQLATQTLHVALATRAEQGNMERYKAAIVPRTRRSQRGHAHYKFPNPVKVYMCASRLRSVLSATS